MVKKVPSKSPAKRIRSGVVTIDEIKAVAESVGDSLNRLQDLIAILQRRGVQKVLIDGILTGEQAKRTLATFNANIDKALARGRTE